MKALISAKTKAVDKMQMKQTKYAMNLFIISPLIDVNFNNYNSADPIKDFLAVISKAKQDGVNRAAVAYYDEQGRQLVAATVPTDSVLAYSKGQITDKQLMAKVDVGTDDIWAFIGLVKDQLK